LGASPNNCTKCAAGYFMSSNKLCVKASNCGTGYVGVLAADSTSGINNCELACTGTKAPDATNIC
jgi:hypothetical protein